MQSQSTTTAVQQDLENQDSDDTPENILVRALDQANEESLHALCTSFYTTDGIGEKIIWATHQLTNVQEAITLLNANELTINPFKLFAFLQHKCPVILKHDLLIDAVSEALSMGKADTTAKMLLAAKVMFPNISEELGCEFVLEDFPHPILDEKRVEAIVKTTALPPTLSTIIASYNSHPEDYESIPARINEHECLTWKETAAFFDLQYILTNLSHLTAKFNAKTAIGTLEIFRGATTAKLGIEEKFFGEGSIQLSCSLHYQDPHCQKLLAVFSALKQRNKITYHKKKVANIQGAYADEEKSNHSDIVAYTDGLTQILILLKTPTGMECGLKSLIHLGLVDPQQALPFCLHTMNTKCLATEAKKCFSIKDYDNKVKPLRTLAAKSRVCLPCCFTGQIPGYVQKTAERILILLDALSERKNTLISMTDDRLKQAMLHVLTTLPVKDRDSILANDSFCEAIAAFKLDLPMMQARKPTRKAEGLPSII